MVVRYSANSRPLLKLQRKYVRKHPVILKETARLVFSALRCPLPTISASLYSQQRPQQSEWRREYRCHGHHQLYKEEMMASLGGSLLSGPGLLNRSISIPPRKGFDYSCTSKTIYLGQQPISKAATAMPRRIDEINRPRITYVRSGGKIILPSTSCTVFHSDGIWLKSVDFHSISARCHPFSMPKQEQ